LPSWVENYLHPQLWLRHKRFISRSSLPADGDRYQSAAFHAVDLLMRLAAACRVKIISRPPDAVAARLDAPSVFTDAASVLDAPSVFTIAITEFTHRLAATSISTFRPFVLLACHCSQEDRKLSLCGAEAASLQQTKEWK